MDRYPWQLYDCLWAQVKDVIRQNIERAMQSKEKLEDLEERAGERARRNDSRHRGMYCVLACTVIVQPGSMVQ